MCPVVCQQGREFQLRIFVQGKQIFVTYTVWIWDLFRVAKCVKFINQVLLTGTGADELFGGYTRHRAALTKRGWKSLHEALEEDWQNIAHRNLARDDRVASDHGRQLRMPYLDEDVVNFVRNLNCWEKYVCKIILQTVPSLLYRTFPSKELALGVGEKILLRCLAYYLGLRNVTTFKKRALQFGSRIANNKERGHDISTRL